MRIAGSRVRDGFRGIMEERSHIENRERMHIGGSRRTEWK